MRWIWVVTGLAQDHIVVADLNLFNARETVAVDGEAVYDEISMKFRNEIPVSVGMESGTVQVATSWRLIPKCRLILAGEEVLLHPKGQPLPAGLSADVRSKLPLSKVPRWAWAFIGGCAIIPFLTAGGAIPAALGFGGAAGCLKIAKNPAHSPLKKALLCGSVLVGAWLGVLLTVVVIGMIKAAAHPA
jgi:hypothetical protein